MPSEEEDYINNEYYAYNLRLFRMIGLWDYQRSSMKFIYVCFINFILIIAAFEQIYTVVTSDRDINSIAKLMETAIPTLCAGSCYYNLLWNGAIVRTTLQTMKKILRRLHCDWNEMAGKPELVILQKYAKLSRLCTVIIMFFYYLYVGFLIYPSFLRIVQYILGLINYNELILPVRFDHFRKNHISYYLCLFIEYAILSIFCTIGAANYSMFISVILHVCALFNVVVWRINDRFKVNRENCHYNVDNVYLSDENDWIVGIIEFYRTVIEFVDLIKLFYETTNLFEGIFALLIMMIDYFYLFQILSANVNKIEGSTKLIYVIASMFVIFAYFNLGQKLIDQNNNVYLTLCQIPFYSLSLRTQKMLLFLIMRSMMVCNLSCMGAIAFSHNLFSLFVQKSLSFAMILYNLV